MQSHMKPLRQIVFFVLLFIAGKSTAQTLIPFPQPGAVYTEVFFQESSLQYEPKNYSFAYTGDTLAGSYTYARLEFYPFGSAAPVCTYYDNGRVYYHDSVPSASNPQAGLLLYDFTLGLGDTFYYPVSDSWWFYNQFPFVVDSVSTITLLNSQVRKYMRLTDGQYNLEWVDGLGDITNGFFYIYGIAYEREHLVCASDSTGALWLADPAFHCDPLDPVPGGGVQTCGVFTYTASIYDQTCDGCDGVINILNVSGGVPPYTYSWSSGGAGNSETDICLGQEVVTVHDANGNSCPRSFYMGWNLPDATYSVDPYLCDGVDTVTIIPLSGYAPFTAMWYPQGVWAMTQVIDSSGEYTVSLRDNAFCGIQLTIDITNVELLQAAPQVTSISCANCCDGNVNLNITGGHPPFTITSLPAANNFCQGWYPYCITDSLGCTYCDSVYVPGVTGIAENAAGTFEVFPNPAADECTLVLATSEPALVRMTDVRGLLICEWKTNGARTTLNVENLACGIYFLTVNGHTQKLVVSRE
jgi:hypothetical protein